jgi:predicted protein tyrosine phosphatase
VNALEALAAAPAEEQARWCVISAFTAQEARHASTPTAIHARIVLDIDDVPQADIGRHLQPCHEFIMWAIRENRQVLVHCRAGISRSASVVVAHLMLRYGMTPDEAIDAVKHARSCVNPNSGFRAQLAALDSRRKNSARHRAVETVTTAPSAIPALALGVVPTMPTPTPTHSVPQTLQHATTPAVGGGAFGTAQAARQSRPSGTAGSRRAAGLRFANNKLPLY